METIIGYNVFRTVDDSKVFVDSFGSLDEARRFCRSHPITLVYLNDHPGSSGYFIIPIVHQVGQLSLNL